MKKKIILGLGDTGLSFARFFSSRDETFEIADSRLSPPSLTDFQKNYPNVPVHLGTFSNDLIQRADTFYLSPSLNLNQTFFQKAKQAGVKLVSDIALFMQHITSPVVGITGTNGKSTVTAWLHHMGTLSKKKIVMGGNIGTPALDLLMEKNVDAVVLELSSFQLEQISVLPLLAACITNISPDHLDRHGDMLAYQTIKQQIYKNAQHIIFNETDPATQPKHFEKEALLYSFSLNQYSNYGIQIINKTKYLTRSQQPILDVTALCLSGKQNWENALVTIALADRLQLEESAIIDGLKTFTGLAHRCQVVKKINGVTWINDSKGTNVSASIAAISGIAAEDQRQLILIAGGQGKSADFTPFATEIAKYCKHVFLYGEDATTIATALQQSVSSVQQTQVVNLSDAVQSAHACAKQNDIVLFSPACASLDMFPNFAVRGECFEQMVLKLYE